MEGPREDEVLVRLVASGICHTDIDFCENGGSDPVVLGHEGSGVVEGIGKTVEGIKPGDPVVLSYQSCGRCRPCRNGHPADCQRFYEANFGFARLDRTNALQGGVRAHFFGRSSLATHTLATVRNLVKVPRTLPLELLAPLGCGLQTGADTVMNSLAVVAARRSSCIGLKLVRDATSRELCPDAAATEAEAGEPRRPDGSRRALRGIRDAQDRPPAGNTLRLSHGELRS